MQLATQSSFDLQRSEEFKTYDISIKTPRVLFEILCDKTYSHPLYTMVQEYMSNARDAHREKGCTDRPIEIVLPNSLNNYELHISDFGIGISTKRMREVFIYLGESTKRADDIQNGGFGIGAKIGFAYSDSFHIISRHSNKELEYLAYKGPDHLGHIDVIGISNIRKEDGVTIIIKIKPQDADRVTQAVFRCSYFWDVVPLIHNLDTGATSLSYPDMDMIGFESDRVSYLPHNIIRELGYTNGPLVVVDRIIYGELDMANIDRDILDGSIIYVKTGEVDVAVNREGLQYSDRTVAKIHEIIDNKMDKKWMNDLVIRHLLDAPGYDLKSMSIHLSRKTFPFIVKPKFTFHWGHFELFIEPNNSNSTLMSGIGPGVKIFKFNTVRGRLEHYVHVFRNNHGYSSVFPLDKGISYAIYEYSISPSRDDIKKWVTDSKKEGKTEFFLIRTNGHHNQYIKTLVDELQPIVIQKPKRKKRAPVEPKEIGDVRLELVCGGSWRSKTITHAGIRMSDLPEIIKDSSMVVIVKKDAFRYLSHSSQSKIKKYVKECIQNRLFQVSKLGVRDWKRVNKEYPGLYTLSELEEKAYSYFKTKDADNILWLTQLCSDFRRIDSTLPNDHGRYYLDNNSFEILESLKELAHCDDPDLRGLLQLLSLSIQIKEVLDKELTWFDHDDDHPKHYSSLKRQCFYIKSILPYGYDPNKRSFGKNSTVNVRKILDRYPLLEKMIESRMRGLRDLSGELVEYINHKYNKRTNHGFEKTEES